MRTRLLQGTDFYISETYITIENHAIDTPSVRLLYDETADVLIASTGVKNNITCSGSVITLIPFDLLNDEGQVIGRYSEFNPTHAYTLAVDYGKIDYAQEETLRGLIEELPKMLFNSHSYANAMNAVVNNVSRKYIVVGETVLQMEGYEVEAYKLAPIDRNSLDSEYVYVERGDFDEGGYIYKLSNMQSVLVGTVESVFSITLNTKEHAESIKQAILTAIANIPQPDLSAVAKEQTLQDTAKEVHEIAVGTDFTFVKNAIISGGARYDYDGLYGYSPRRGMSVSFYRWRNTLQGYVCTLLDDTKVDGVIYGWTNELVPPEAGSHGKPTDPTGGTIESFEYDNLETEKMATANKQEIIQKINSIPAGGDATAQNQERMLMALNVADQIPELVAMTDTEILQQYNGYTISGVHTNGIADTTYGHRVPVEVTIDDETLTLYQERTYADYGYTTLYAEDGDPFSTNNHPTEGDILFTSDPNAN